MSGHPSAHPVGCLHAPAGGTRPCRGMGAGMHVDGCIDPAPSRTHAVGWVHSSRLMGASFPRDGGISPVGSMRAPAGWVHPSHGMGASFWWDRCIDVVGGRADVDAPIPLRRAPIPHGRCTHTTGRMHPSRWGTHPPPTAGRPCRTNRTARCRFSGPGRRIGNRAQTVSLEGTNKGTPAPGHGVPARFAFTAMCAL